MSHPPTVLALCMCDQAIIDRDSDKVSLIGMFSSIFAPQFPALHPRMTVYLAITDGYGDCPITIDLVDGQTESLRLFNVEQGVRFGDPRHVVETTTNLGPIHIPQPGEYRLRVSCSGVPLISRRLICALSPRPPGQPQPPHTQPPAHPS